MTIPVILPRFIRLRDAPAYLGMDRHRFNYEVRPHLTEIPIAQFSQLRHVETENPLFFNGSSQKVCTTFARLFLQ
jgi:hypothetical protein